MKAKEFVLSKYPNACAFSMIDNRRGRNSYVIIKGNGISFEIFPNEHANTASKAWTNAKKQILKESASNWGKEFESLQKT